MRKLVLLSLVLISLFAFSCDAQTNKKPAIAATNNGDVEVYYFHMTTRCVTCKTIEAEARKDIEMLYPEQFKSGKITFTALNIEEPAGQITGERTGG